MEEKINTLIDYGLYDDGSVSFSLFPLAILLAEEENYLQRDEKWLILIAKALFRQQFYYRSILCLNSCFSTESMSIFFFIVII